MKFSGVFEIEIFRRILVEGNLNDASAKAFLKKTCFKTTY